MKAWKFIVLVGGVLGLIGFFLPFVKAGTPGGKGEVGVSGFQFVRGIGDISKMIPEEDLKGIGHEELARAEKVFNDTLQTASGYVLMFYIPAALVLLLGAICVARGKMGRFAGLLALLVGGASAGVWALFNMVANEDKAGNVSLGMGLHLILVAGICGMVAGLGCLVKPDNPEALTTRVA
jgi:hypothetical protein